MSNILSFHMFIMAYIFKMMFVLLSSRCMETEHTTGSEFNVKKINFILHCVCNDIQMVIQN